MKRNVTMQLKRQKKCLRARTILSAVILLCMLTAGVSIRGYAAEGSDQEVFPEGITQKEKQQLLQEMYEDINADEEFTPDMDREDVLGEDLTDEEVAQILQDVLPDEMVLDQFATEFEEQILALADYRVRYEAARKMYACTLPTGYSFYISVPLGCWTDHAVVLQPEEGIAIASVIRDGEQLALTPDEEGAYFFRETGTYSFMAYEPSAEKRTYLCGSFRILDARVPITDSFVWAPEGYRISSASVNGSSLKVRDGRYLQMDRDGVYDLQYSAKNADAGMPESLRVMFSRDTTAPVINWDGEVRGGKFIGDVKYSLPEPDTEVAIWYNGQPAISPTKVLAAEGNYFITASDPTGNTRSYSIIVEQSGRLPVGIIAAAAAVLAAAAVILIATGKAAVRIR